jgi:hypothetical protein
MKIYLIAPADQELMDVISYYNTKSAGLGEEFYREFKNALNLIKRFPKMWSKIGNNTRKCIIKSFPFLILYVLENDKILITCIAHQYRNPEYYIKRIK